MADLTRTDIKAFTDALRAFCRENEITMGIDNPDDKPAVVYYVFWQVLSNKGCMFDVDFDAVDDIEETIKYGLERLRDIYDKKYLKLTGEK